MASSKASLMRCSSSSCIMATERLSWLKWKQDRMDTAARCLMAMDRRSVCLSGVLIQQSVHRMAFVSAGATRSNCPTSKSLKRYLYCLPSRSTVRDGSAGAASRRRPLVGTSGGGAAIWVFSRTALPRWMSEWINPSSRKAWRITLWYSTSRSSAAFTSISSSSIAAKSRFPSPGYLLGTGLPVVPRRGTALDTWSCPGVLWPPPSFPGAVAVAFSVAVTFRCFSASLASSRRRWRVWRRMRCLVVAPRSTLATVLPRARSSTRHLGL
mmetsp:Transcript_45/g.164  ORF Transcript_45/g.164 Transcript_45/m.164 type:complete len:268 (-) Transcript_45:555-1358(-)